MAGPPKFQFLFAAIPVEALADENLTPADLKTLAIIAFHDGLGRNKRGCYASYDVMAEEIKLTRETVTGSIGRLGEGGYISVQPNQQNRRLRILSVNYRTPICNGALTDQMKQSVSQNGRSVSASRSICEVEKDQSFETKTQFDPNRPEQTVKNREEDNKPSSIDVRKALEQTMVYQGGSLKRATRSGLDTSDPVVRKQVWENKVCLKLFEVSPDHADDIINAYQHGEEWAVTQFNAVSDQYGLKRQQR